MGGNKKQRSKGAAEGKIRKKTKFRLKKSQQRAEEMLFSPKRQRKIDGGEDMKA